MANYQVTLSPATEKTASELCEIASREMLRLWEIKPRSLKKMFGANGPTEKQLRQWKDNMAKWNNQYRKACKDHEKYLPLANAEFYAAQQKETLARLDKL